ncbi:shufflon system plasmid conjugative transfer pilus tip adhesin PilV, partial [Pectobacterium versatile]
GDEKSQGALCGFASDDHLSGNINIYLCKGHNPSISCPHDYVRSRIFQADSNYLYSCVVIKELIGS